MKIKLIDTVMAFGFIFEPGKKYGKYIVRPLIKKGSDNELLLREAIDRALTETFGPKWGVVKKGLTGNKSVLRDGDERADEFSEYANMLYINAKSDGIPKAFGQDGCALTKVDDVFYPGCRVDVIIDLFAHHNDFGDFILTKLLGVQFRADGLRLTGAAGSNGLTEDDHAPITAGADAGPL